MHRPDVATRNQEVNTKKYYSKSVYILPPRAKYIDARHWNADSLIFLLLVQNGMEVYDDMPLLCCTDDFNRFKELLTAHLFPMEVDHMD